MTTLLSSNIANETNTSLVFWNISWSQFKAIQAAFADIAGVRLVYLDGVLEIMTLSPEHEETKSIIRALLEAYLRQAGIRFYMRGSATLHHLA